jgi:type I restriction enzyme S subunit
VAEIEKQFTRLEAGVSALKRVQANLKRYRAAVLKAACEGKLVPTEAELHKVGRGVSPSRSVGAAHSESSPYLFETGEELLERILAERRKSWSGRGKYKEPAAPDTANLLPLPEGWTWGTSSQVLREVKDGTHDTPEYHPIGIPFITQKHVKPTGLVFDDYKFISKEDHDHFYQRSNPERGDILVSMIGVNRGESCLINNDEVFSIKNVGLFKPHHSLSHAKFIQYYLSSRLGQQLILKQSKGGAQPFIGLTELRSWPIPLPPLAEQTRIVAEVERRLSVVEELEAVVSANLQRAGRLRQSILQKAFSGGLVRQGGLMHQTLPQALSGEDGI